jgi:flagellar FliJ protein
MFQFPLQRILDLRAKREAEVARQLANAKTAAEATRQTRDALAAAHEAGQRQLAGAQGGGITAGEMQSLTFVLAQLDQHIPVADEAAQAAEAAVAEVHRELTSALQDRRVLDRLRERRLEAYRSAETAKDQQTMDAVALSRFNQNASTDSTTPDGSKGGESGS